MALPGWACAPSDVPIVLVGATRGSFLAPGSPPASAHMWIGPARPCPALPGPAGPCPALPGPARPCRALPGPAGPCPACSIFPSARLPRHTTSHRHIARGPHKDGPQAGPSPTPSWTCSGTPRTREPWVRRAGRGARFRGRWPGCVTRPRFTSARSRRVERRHCRLPSARSGFRDGMFRGTAPAASDGGLGNAARVIARSVISNWSGLLAGTGYGVRGTADRTVPRLQLANVHTPPAAASGVGPWARGCLGAGHSTDIPARVGTAGPSRRGASICAPGDGRSVGQPPLGNGLASPWRTVAISECARELSRRVRLTRDRAAMTGPWSDFCAECAGAGYVRRARRGACTAHRAERCFT